MQVKTPQSELYDKLLLLGWNLKKIDFKNGLYVAKADNETTGQEVERSAKTSEMALAQVYQYATRAYEVRRLASIKKIAAWSEDWLDQATEIGQAYSKMPPFDEKAVPAWKALAAESRIQADAIRKQITVEVVDDPEPYTSAQQMCEDVHKNKHFSVSRANSEHPIWSVEDNINFRIVHDVLGHCQSGGDFSWRGENLACGVHFPLVSPLAREALFTECIGQQAYYRTFHGFGPQKVGFLSQYLHPVQERQGEHVWVPHGGVPDLAPAANGNAKGTMDAAPGMQGIFNSPGDWVQPSQFTMPMAAPPSPTFAMPSAVMQPFEVKTHQIEAAKMVSPDRPYDPNRFFQPSVQSPPLEDPANDYIGIADTVDNAAKIDTNWQEEDEATQKRAIINAFRVALLSPRKHLKWNAAHYQAIMHTDPSTKAVDLWNLLEEAREKHNQGLGYPEGSHLSYRKQLDFLAHELQVDDPKLSNSAAVREAKEIVFRKVKEFEAQLGADPANEDTSELKRYNMARKLVDAWLKENYTPVRGWQPGQMTLASDSEPKLFETDDEWKPIDASGFASQDAKYGAFMGTHLDAIEEVGQHIDQIRDAALKDLDEDGGKGFIFRNAVMNMNLKGVNPKVASFAWLLLAPMTSELGIIDTHVLRGLRRSEQDMTPRDYYKLERMQRAGKDATGYSHLPLGMYHWGLWDAIRNPGEHSDHSPLRILDPVPWDSPSAKWDAAMNAKSGPWVGPMQFENARGHMEQTANDFDQEMAGQPHNLIPLAQAPFKQEPASNAYVIPSL